MRQVTRKLTPYLTANSTLLHKSTRSVLDISLCLSVCTQVVLEAEVTNKAALGLYANLGFVRDKYLHRYYLNGADAYRLKLWLTEKSLQY